MFKVYYGRFHFGYYAIVFYYYDFDNEPCSVNFYKRECYSLEDLKKYVYSRNKDLKENKEMTLWIPMKEEEEE